ncbi:tRNA-specific adenosine deaminase [Megasphaera sp. ASD88]|uniref:tRNA adenosine(34) deaminase TadA n=1 Tax=Megasphaera TaxID=906 RepID=UPI0008229D01|nr:MULTISPECIES: tRNA adenosine(34) deaminase TadA [Megasphaera]MCU6715171.1 tRNA adenosine(34) deaminase TadA [Megasphaera butyrica]PAV39925.1 tRNA-specific adenosine deaminase [Megasphaera sp. ASD88]SCH96518.1 tRNA-specific adenosine deaminase [uncultured Megasphaera sp.]SCJ50903.1 tRNA-specific adenosine deaminase [uncultured Ruminococcus sp.]
MTKDEFYMGKAIEEAKIAAAVGEIPVGAVVIYQKRAIARAYNLRETLPCATAHAELLAIEKACRALGRWRLTGCTLYVTVEPCPMCAGAIVNSRLDRIVYGCDDPKGGAVRSLFQIVDNPALNHRVEVTAGVRADECAAIMRDFFRSRRRK